MKMQLTNKQLQDSLTNCTDNSRKLTKENKHLDDENKRLKAKIETILNVCVQRRSIALDMAAHVAEDFSHLPAARLKQKILDLIKITQKDHDTLVARYHMKERYGE